MSDPTAWPWPGFPMVGEEKERDRAEKEGTGGSVHRVLPQEGESRGDGALSPALGGGRSHFILRSWAREAEAV